MRIQHVAGIERTHFTRPIQDVSFPDIWVFVPPKKGDVKLFSQRQASDYIVDGTPERPVEIHLWLQ